MRDLSVKFWQKRGHWVINANRVGLDTKHGRFATEAAARQEAEMLKAKFLTGQIAAPVSITKCGDAAAAFLQAQMRRVEDGEISNPHYHDLRRGMDFSLAIKVDGKPFAKLDLSKAITKANKDDLAAAFKREIKAQSASKSTAEKRIKVLKAFFNYCQAKGWTDLNPLDKVSFGLSTEIADRAPKIQPETVQKLVYSKLLRMKAVRLVSQKPNAVSAQYQCLARPSKCCVRSSCRAVTSLMMIWFLQLALAYQNRKKHCVN